MRPKKGPSFTFCSIFLLIYQLSKIWRASFWHRVHRFTFLIYGQLFKKLFLRILIECILRDLASGIAYIKRNFHYRCPWLRKTNHYFSMCWFMLGKCYIMQLLGHGISLVFYWLPLVSDSNIHSNRPLLLWQQKTQQPLRSGLWSKLSSCPHPLSLLKN